MLNRLYIRVPSTNCEPKLPCNRYYFADNTMVDLNNEVRCATCAAWVYGAGEQGNCGRLVIGTDADFGCAMWRPLSDRA